MKVYPRCKSCGQVILPQLNISGPIKQRIYNLLKQQPRTPEELRDLIWGNRRPIDPQAIYVHVYALKKQLRLHDLTIRCEWRGAYHLEVTK